MNSRISRRLLMGWCLIICPLSYSSAQSDDFGLDFSVEAEKKIDKQWSVSLEGELRRRDDAKTNDRWSIGLVLRGL